MRVVVPVLDAVPDDAVAVPLADVPLAGVVDVAPDGKLLVVVVAGVVVTGVLLIGAALLDNVLLEVVLLAAAEAPVKSTMKVSMRVEHPNAVSGPSVPSQ